MRPFRTLRGRLTAFALLAATISVAILVAAFNLVLAQTLHAHLDSRVRTQAAAVATTIRTENGQVKVLESPNDAAIDAQVWIFQGRREVARSRGTPEVQRAAQSLAGRAHVFLDVPQREVRLYALPLTEHGVQIGTVVAGQSLDGYERTTQFALIGTLALAGFVLVAVYAVTWLTIGRALRPVTEMTRSAAEWSEHELDRRFGAQPREDELGQLAATFDDLLDRLSASLRHEQRLSAELSHELRTPLARIIAEMELLQRRERTPQAREDAYEVIGRSAEQMSRILESLMAAARAEAAPQRGRSHLGEALEALESEWADPLARRGVRLDVRRPDGDLTVGADAEVVERVLGPLLENACRYAAGRVTMEGQRADGRVRIVVRDDGPGIADGEIERVFEPGVRGERVNGHGGAGLGLPLARRLARAAGGDVSAAAGSEGGGATFVVELPA